ncbi:hypothetical protein FHS83_001262 [Rhizomicrobium palustre]|uniref:Haem-binding uptake Tiki superfamily ChaN domain-containing protein n=1 Tax=Rhizomicrobium palustre TaxID=189966 RepID=A0A846MWN7_9PROT|nr:DUF5694 domain-containing protein [Rhizomicrobium palustre]NIK87944.1 hypothetical protein [Rhizomicrobium palustre]
MKFAASLFAGMLFAASPAFAADAPIEVMVVGLFHMSNPGHDLANVKADDMLAETRQKEIAATTAGLSRFRPTIVAVEWPEGVTNERYASYRAGTLEPSPNEVVQLGFRLAKESGLTRVDGIDVDGNFPFEAVEAFAKAHGQKAALEGLIQTAQQEVAAIDAVLAKGTVSATLRYLNEPATIFRSQNFYRSTLLFGAGDDQPGAALMTGWYERNFRICAKLVQRAKPGDRVVMFYGAGHAFLLRQCISEMPGYRLVEPNTYLP